MANLVLKFADIVNDKKHKAVCEEKKYAVLKLFQYRNKFYEYVKNLENEKNPIKEIIQPSTTLIIKLSR